jgi:hypothetical protein
LSRKGALLGLLALLAGLWTGTLSRVQPASQGARSEASLVAEAGPPAAGCDCLEPVQRATERAERLCQERIERLGGVEPPAFPDDLDAGYRPEDVEALAESLRACEELAEQILVDCDEYPCILMLDGLGSSNVRACGLELDTLFFRVSLEPATMVPQRATFALVPKDRAPEQERRRLQARFEARQAWLHEQLQSDTGTP